MYGLYGILFAASNCGIIVLCSTLHLRRRALATAFGLLYVAFWAQTIAASASVRDDAMSKLQESFSVTTERTVARFDVDPVALNTPQQLQWPWYHVGDASVPCPFVIVFDHATMTETFGYGGRAHVLSIFGDTWTIVERPNWIRC